MADAGQIDAMLTQLELLGAERIWHDVPIPIAWDASMLAWIGAFVDLPADARAALAERINAAGRDKLGWFGTRSPTWAVRTDDPELLVPAVVAIGLGCFTGRDTDWRSGITGLPPAFDAAHRLGTTPAVIFRRAERVLGPDAVTRLEEYLRRPSEVVALSRTAWDEGSDADGFRYVIRRWDWHTKLEPLDPPPEWT